MELLADLAVTLETRAERAKETAEGNFGDERDVPEGEAAAYRDSAVLIRGRITELAQSSS